MNLPKKAGTLYLCATPIGNLGDITLRALQVLKEVDLIAAEDTRRTRKLLSHYDIKTPLTSYHSHNQRRSGDYLMQRLTQGQNIALVSDAGTPGLSDPGTELVQLAVQQNIPVIPLPGANALLPALTVSGLPTDQFVFVGFLPRQNKKRQMLLQVLAVETKTMVLYEAPHRLLKTLGDLIPALGLNRQACVARELTKKFEQIHRGTLDEIYQHFNQQPPRGELVLVLAGATGDVHPDQGTSTDQVTPEQQVAQLVQQGLKPNEAIKKVARQRNIPRRDLYNSVHKIACPPR